MKYVNKKNKKEYTIITLDGIDCTNERDGLRGVIYTNGEPLKYTGKTYG